MNGQEVQFQPRTQRTSALLSNYYVDPRLFFRHLSYEYRIGKALLYYADERLEHLNMMNRNWAQTGNPADITRLDVEGNTVVDKRGEVAPGIFVQLIGNKLFIRDRRAKDHGLRIRSSQGTVHACAYEHRRAEAMGIFDKNNLVRNGLFRSTEESGNVAAGWFVSGDVNSLTVLGGQGMATESTGRLWQPLRVAPDRHYVLYARLSVTRGNVIWSLADPDRGFESRGEVEPGRMSEIVSDVVPSRSGSLKVTFEAPSGGAFRVIDVIVGEAPKYSLGGNASDDVQ